MTNPAAIFHAPTNSGANPFFQIHETNRQTFLFIVRCGAGCIGPRPAAGPGRSTNLTWKAGTTVKETFDSNKRKSKALLPR
jgi:hypothetical protein